jgi:hypothetical protein
MRPSRARGLVPASVALCALLTAGAAGARVLAPSSPAQEAANSMTWQVSPAPDPQAPNISSVTASNTDAGMISLKVAISNRPELTQDMIIDIFVDTDFNSSTGSQDIPGTDYVIELSQSEVNLFKWDGTNFTRRFGDPSAITLSYSYASGPTFRISANELGNTKKFRFLVIATSGVTIDPVTGDIDFTNAHTDVAPAGGAGLYPFEVKTAPTRLVVKKLTTSPSKPVAGKAFTAKLSVVRSDTGAGVKGGQISCVARIGGASLRAKVRHFVGSQAVCTWLVPANAKGKSFRGSIAVVFEGLRAAKSISGTIG